MNHYLTTEQAAAMLGVAPGTVRGWVLRRSVPFYKIGGAIRFDPQELRDWVASSKVVPTAPFQRA